MVPTKPLGVADRSNKDAQLFDKVYLYITEKWYADEVSENGKRIIRKKASKFTVIDGEMYLTKKRGKV